MVSSRLTTPTLERDHPEFDIIFMNMAIMDVATLEPLARNLPNLLAKDGV